MNAQHTTEKDIHWLYDDDAIEPPPVAEAEPITTPDVGQEDVTQLYTSSDDIEEGNFTEEIEGEVVDDPPRQRGVPIRYLIPIGIGALSLALVAVLVVVPFFQASATIIITPDRQTISMSTTLSTQARKLFTKSVTLSQTVKTTGTAHQIASVGRGYITFYNSLPTPQTVPAGTMIAGADGVSIITDADAFIPAGTLATNGQTTISAHTTTTGTQANIQAGDINGACCRDYVFARNNQFSGGQDARNYQTPTKTDIQASSQNMTGIIQESMNAEEQKQLQPGEDALPAVCTRKTTSNTNPGIEATTVLVTLISSCTAYGYDRQEVTDKEASTFNQAIYNQLGSGYVRTGQLTQKVTEIRQWGSTRDNTTIEITANLSGMCVYHFTQEEIRNMQQIVAGASQTQATILLLHTRGVKTAGIQIDNGKTSVPDNVQNIAVSVLERG